MKYSSVRVRIRTILHSFMYILLRKFPTGILATYETAWVTNEKLK